MFRKANGDSMAKIDEINRQNLMSRLGQMGLLLLLVVVAIISKVPGFETLGLEVFIFLSMYVFMLEYKIFRRNLD